MGIQRDIVLVLGKRLLDSKVLGDEAKWQVREATALLRSKRWQGATLVITGGMTLPDFPFSEAEVFLAEFPEELRHGAILECASTTTPENIRFVKELLKHRGIEVGRMVVVSTWAHCLEVFLTTIPYFWREVWWRTQYHFSPSDDWRGSRNHLCALLMRAVDPWDRRLVPWLKRRLEGNG